MIMKRGGVKRVCLGRDVDWSIIVCTLYIHIHLKLADLSAPLQVYTRDPCTRRIAHFVEVRERVKRIVVLLRSRVEEGCFLPDIGIGPLI